MIDESGRPMPDSKYGRLFTEADVRAILAEALVHPEMLVKGSAVPVQSIADDVLKHDRTFPADEPLFLLRGQDRYAPWGAQFYVDGLASHLADVGAGEANVSREHFDAAHKAWQAMLFWQRKHPDRVKVPD